MAQDIQCKYKQVLEYTHQKNFSNTSAWWITRNKQLLEWSQRRKYSMYTLQIWHNEQSMYAKYKRSVNRKNIEPKFIM